MTRSTCLFVTVFSILLHRFSSEVALEEDFLEDEIPEEAEDIVFKTPGDIERLIQATVKEHFRSGVATDDLWGVLNEQADQIAVERVAEVSTSRQDGLQSALLPARGRSALALQGDLAYDPVDPSEGGSKVEDTKQEEGARESSSGLVAAVQEQVGEVAQSLATGSVALAGAFSHLPEDLSLGDKRPTPYMMTAWFLAVERQEANARDTPPPPEEFPTEDDRTLMEWVAANGGETYALKYSEMPEKPGGMRGFLAADDIEAGEVVLKVPFRLAISAEVTATIRTSGGFLRGILKDVFRKSEEWGLAVVLLHEHFHALHDTGKSRFGPFTRTLHMYEFTSRVMRELQGSYAADFKREWEDECEKSYQWLSQNLFTLHPSIFLRNPHRVQAGPYNREDWRWALGVVRRRAITITRAASGLRQLALVPLVDLVPHSAHAGGQISLSTDNMISVTVSEHSQGAEVRVERGNFTDAECLFKFHEVEASNPSNKLLLSLPGARLGTEQESDNIIKQVERIRHWRKTMNMPPRSADLWRHSDTLQLYGSSQESEMHAIGYNQYDGTVDGPAWEQGGQLAVVGADRATSLYSPSLFDMFDGEEGHLLAAKASKALAEAAMQMQASAAMEAAHQYLEEDVQEAGQEQGPEEERRKGSGEEAEARSAETESFRAALNATKNFFFYGVQPSKGLDALDQMLMKKMDLMQRCGGGINFTLTTAGVNPGLLCGSRLVLADDVEVWSFFVKKRHGGTEALTMEQGGFNPDLPISLKNEVAAIQALRDSIRGLLDWFPTSLEEDEALLQMHSLRRAQRATIQLRYNEKQLLGACLVHLAAVEELARAGNVTFQFESMQEAQAAVIRGAEEAQKAEEARMERLRIYLQPKQVSEVSVNLGAESPVIVRVLEGEDREAILQRFAEQHKVGEDGVSQVRGELQRRTLKQTPIVAALSIMAAGRDRPSLLAVREGDSVEARVQEFVDVHGMAEEQHTKVLQAVSAEVDRKIARKVYLEIQVTSPDGQAVVVRVRDGEQHDPRPVVQQVLEAHRLGPAAVDQVLPALQQRLPPPRVVVPVDMGSGRVVKLRVADGEEPLQVVRAFAQVQGIGEEATIMKLVEVINQRLYPDALRF